MKALTLTFLLLLLQTNGGLADVAVIVHPSVSAESISKSELLDLYTGDSKTWNNGESVVVIDLKTKNDAKKIFYKYLGKSSSRMKSIWMKNLLSGEGQPPESVESEAALLAKVAATPGAVGYVSAELVDSKVITLFVIKTQGD